MGQVTSVVAQRAGSLISSFVGEVVERARHVWEPYPCACTTYHVTECLAMAKAVCE